MNQTQLFTKELHFKKYLEKHFPQIYRIIAEENYWLWMGIGVNMVLFIFFTLQLMWMIPKWYSMQYLNSQFTQNAALWENIGNTYQNYQDAYLQATIFSYQAKDLTHAQISLEKTLLLDPTSPKAQTLARLLVFEKERELEK